MTYRNPKKHPSSTAKAAFPVKAVFKISGVIMIEENIWGVKLNILCILGKRTGIDKISYLNNSLFCDNLDMYTTLSAGRKIFLERCKSPAPYDLVLMEYEPANFNTLITARALRLIDPEVHLMFFPTPHLFLADKNLSEFQGYILEENFTGKPFGHVFHRVLEAKVKTKQKKSEGGRR